MEENVFDQMSVLPQTLGLAGEVERERRALLVLRAGKHLIGIFADEARSVNEHCSLTPLPRAPAAVLGIACVRGRMHTVLDPAHLLRAPEIDGGAREAENEPSQQTYIVALGGDEQLALKVEEVRGVIELLPEDLLPLDHAGRLVKGVIENQPSFIIVLNQAELFDAAMQGAERRRKRS